MKAAMALLASCLFIGAQAFAGDSITEKVLGKLPDGAVVHVYMLKNAKGVEAVLSDYGARVISLNAPDRNGKMADVIVGGDTIASLINPKDDYLGALVGRCANRIAKGKFSVEGRVYNLAKNEPPNHLHGGLKGFDKVFWKATPSLTKDGPQVVFTYLSKDGEEGYPGNLSVTATYILQDDNSLKIDIEATTDKMTVCNITSHACFNLAGEGNILKHRLMIPADYITPVDPELIPNGTLMRVLGTPFDFSNPAAIGSKIEMPDGQLRIAKGYDHNWIIKKKSEETSLMARIYDPISGRVMEVSSNQPGLQFYSGNRFDSKAIGKGGKAIEFRNGFCLEPQHYPNSPNKSSFPSVALMPGEVYKNIIIYKFSTAK